MVSDFLQNEDDPKDYWTRMVRTTKLLLLIATLVVLDGFNRQWNMMRSYDQLQIALYDFTVKYREPLEKWYRASVPGASTQDVVVRFERRYSGRELTPGYFSLDEVPLLDGYLRDHFPFSSENRRFLGYEMHFGAYIVLV